MKIKSGGRIFSMPKNASLRRKEPKRIRPLTVAQQYQGKTGFGP